VKVDVRFRDILKIWWTYCVVDFFRSLLAIVAVNINSKALAHLYQFLFLNDFLGVAAVIILHVYRFQHSGKWCSGDFLEPELARVQRDGYLIERGKILLGLVMYVWVGLLTYSCILSCLITAANRRDKGGEKVVQVQSQEDSEKVSLVSGASQPYEKEIRTVIAACQAASSGHVRILELLIKKGININEGDYDKRTPLHVASAANQLETVRVLLDHGANVNPFDRWGSTPLNDAENKEIEALLLSKGAKRGKKLAYQPIKLQTLRDDDNRLFYAAFKNDTKNMAILKNTGW
jgi:Ankyrin repeats (3 copies)